MDAIPYVDSLVKEYLLFRGFTGSLRALNKELASDRGCGFQADQLCELVFRKLLPLDQASELMEVLDFLSKRVYSRLPGSYEDVIRKLEVSILRAYIVNAVQAGKPAVVQQFFSQYGQLLLQRAESSDWLQWFALPYLKDPAQDIRFQVFFSTEWLTLVETSFRNFLAEAIQHLPPPALLRFDADRLQRSALQKQVDRLQTENAGLKQQIGASSRGDTPQGVALTAQQSSHHSQQYTKAGASADADEGSAHSQAQLQQQQQQHQVRFAKYQEAATISAAPLPHPRSQDAELDALLQGPASETSQWVLADGNDQQPPSTLQEAASDISGQELPAEDSQHTLSLSGADLQPMWSASLASLDASVLAESDAGTLSQLSAVGDDTLSLDTQASSPRMIRQQAQPQAQPQTQPQALSEAQPQAQPDVAGTQSGALLSDSSRQTRPKMQHQHRLPNGASQSSAHNEFNGLSQHQPQPGMRDDRATDSNNFPTHESTSASMDSVATAVHLTSHTDAITCCSFSPNGLNLATASADGVVRISASAPIQGDTGNTGREATLLCGARISVVAWDHRADKVMLVGTKGRGVKAWHLDTKSMISHVQLDQAHPTVLDIACSPTDPSFVCAAASTDMGSSRSGSLTVWNMRAFKKLRSFDVPEDTAVGSISFSPDGHTMAAGSSDGCLRIYDVHSNRGAPVAAWSLQSRQHHAPAVTYFADGSAIVSLSQTGQLQQWDLRRLSSKKLGQPQWTVNLTSFCAPLPKSHWHIPAVSQTSRRIATTSAKTELPVVILDGALRNPCVQSSVAGEDVECAKGDESASSAKFVSAVHWHPTFPTLCCGLDNGQVWLQHFRTE